jgi:RimJ/RimL family protein N-acetyltransferase
MTSPHWPLTGLRLRTPRLELRWPSLADLDELVTLAAAGVHDPQVQPFSAEWTDVAAAELPGRSLRFFWSQWASWHPADWELSFAVVHRGAIVGVQALKAANFAVLREVHTGSWIGREYQGHGIGTEMRAAVLSLAFGELHAQYARSTAHSDNAASLGVSRKLGYADDGIEHLVVRGRVITARRLLLDRATWQGRRPLRARVSGLEPCLPWFGHAPAPAAATGAPAGR